MNTNNKQTQDTSKTFTFGSEFQFSKHQPINIQPAYGREWILNGDNNKNFQRYIDAYDDSPTNSSIINSFVSYIQGEGLIDLNGQDISHIISNEDFEMICHDYKKFGGASAQVIWSEANEPLKIEYIPIYKLGINYNENQNYSVDGYWYSYDWKNRSKYIPKLYPKFTGTYKGNGLEILYFRKATTEPFFPIPDYFSGIPWAEVEGELANSAIKHFINYLPEITVINYNGGFIGSEEAAKEEAKKRREQVCGTDKTSTVIVSMNDGAEGSTTIDRVAPPELNNQNVFYAEEAERKLIVAHSAPKILFESQSTGSGFSSNADEREITLKEVYRKHINPSRKVILNALGSVFKLIDSSIKLDVKDFESEDNLDTVENADPTIVTGNSILDDKTLEAQASLKGSVGGVQSLLEIQSSYAQGLTTYESAISMLDLIFGYNREQAVKLLGQPKKETV